MCWVLSNSEEAAVEINLFHGEAELMVCFCFFHQ